MPGELDFQNLSTVQSALQPKPATLASANTIAPTGFLTVLTGNTVVKTITPPLPNSVHMIAIQYAGVAGNDTTGNITLLMTSIASQIILYVWNPLTAKYTPVQ
ncbi:MAG TPA: hypothetical protein VNX68_17895 [Nitrosopumilaceae archaeon]|jgi:hypothetical protein|nr:hypothetical protein [Nitrosopumilaceae archaeon]